MTSAPNEIPSMETVTARALRGRRSKRLQAVATARRLALETERVARDQRVDAAVVDVLAAREAWTTAMNDASAADTAAGAALRRLRAEGISLPTAAELCELTTSTLRRLLTDNPSSPQNAASTASRGLAPGEGAHSKPTQTRSP
jgi:hypothetical protein